MTRPFSLVLLALSSCWLTTAGWAADPVDIDEVHWYGAYLSGAKIGHAAMGSRPATWAGHDAIETFMETTLTISMLGVTQQLLLKEKEYTAPDTGAFLGAEVFTDTGLPGMDQHTRITRQGETLQIDFLANGEVASHAERAWAPGTLSSREAAELIKAELDPKLGGSFTYMIFSSSSQSAVESRMRYAPLSTLYYDGVTFDAYEVTSEIPSMGITSTGYETADGMILRTSVLNGLFDLRLEEESLAKGPTAAPDMLAMSKVKVVGARIPTQPVAHLEVVPEIDGDIAALFSTTSRQRLAGTSDAPALVIDMLGPGQGPATPLSAADRTRYLADTLHIQSAHPRIVALATDIVKTIPASDPLKRAFAITQYVYQHLEKELVPTTPNALQVLDMGKGDCGEHAVLTAALLRAAGLPAKTLYGLVYAPGYGQGFFFHAWNGVLIQDRWLEVDSALGMFPADATHVVLGETDDLANATGILPLYGRLQFRVTRALAGEFEERFVLRAKGF